VPDADLTPQPVRVGVWQALADVGEGTLCPFNTQSTAVRRELFPLLYLPSTVTFRFTDILRGLVAQPIMWAAGFRLGFTEATVVQDRNPHNLPSDFADEVPMYLRGADVPDLVSRAISAGASVAENVICAYDALLEARIVEVAEMSRLQAWLDELSLASSR